MEVSKKRRRRITPEEVDILGLSHNIIHEGRDKEQHSLDEFQWEQILRIRNKGVIASLDRTQVGVQNTKHLWHELRDSEGNKIGNAFVKNPLYKEDSEENNILNEIFLSLKDEIEPEEPVAKPKKILDSSICNQYTLTDYHLGMMAWAEESGDDWDLKIAEETIIKFFKVAIEESPNAESCIFAQIGDFLHWDGLEAITPTSNHVLDADTRFTKLVRVAIRVIRKIIHMLLKKYKKVIVIMAEGNHDLASSVWLREMLSAFYDKEKRLYIETNPDPYYCITFGKCCLFYHHSHKKKLKELDKVFVSKFKKEFGTSKYVYGHTGHLHHEHKIESNLMILEQHRTLSAKDSYSSRGGYGSGRDAKVITYHKKYGEVTRNTISINRLK